MNAKYKNLLDCIAEKGKVAVAFSGGSDSSFLCHAACEALGKNAIAITIVSPLLPKNELQDAKDIAKTIGLEHVFVETGIDENVAENTRERCYFCKKKAFAAVMRAAGERGIDAVLDGSNLDDESDFRPGMRALRELGVSSPLREARLSKAEIREMARLAGIPAWDKPALACLASRVPYGQRIDEGLLRRIEAGEDVLREFGFRGMRLRAHGDIARIEAAREERRKFFSEDVLDDVSRRIKELGFAFVAMELEGYEMGSLNR